MFLKIDMSQGSVATRFGCGGIGIFNDTFIANFPDLTLPVKEFGKFTEN